MGRAGCWFLCVQYFAAEAIAIAGWRGAYSFHDNYISDLGALACIGSGCSPLHGCFATYPSPPCGGK